MHKNSFSLKTSELQRRFLLIDCKNEEKPVILGRLATEIVRLLKGKDLPQYTPHTCGADTKIIIINAEYLKVTGNKENQKLYRRHTGYAGGLKETLYKNMKKRDIILHAIKGMINKGPMRNQLLKKIYIYLDHNHLHGGQKPVLYNI